MVIPELIMTSEAKNLRNRPRKSGTVVDRLNDQDDRIEVIIEQNLQLQKTVDRLSHTMEETNRMMNGDQLNTGVYFRLKKVEDTLRTFMKEVQQREAKRVGYLLGVSGLITFILGAGWAILKGVIWLIEHSPKK